jgi:ABC-type nickel/cobalt efflux system permease component RcnA
VIVRLRLRIGVYISALLLFGGFALVAQATQAVTRSEMESFVLATIGAAGVLVFAAFWVLLNTINGRSERALLSSVNRLEHAVDKLLASMEAHDQNPLAHAAAGEHNHRPMNEQLDRLEAQLTATAQMLDALIRDHNRIQRAEGDICHALEEIRKRNPADSPKPRRKDDSRDDYTALRGKG